LLGVNQNSPDDPNQTAIVTRDLQIEDFIENKVATWQHLLQICQVEWLHEKVDMYGNYQDKITKDLIKELLSSKYYTAMRKYLDIQKKQQEQDRQQMMSRLNVNNYQKHFREECSSPLDLNQESKSVV